MRDKLTSLLKKKKKKKRILIVIYCRKSFLQNKADYNNTFSIKSNAVLVR